MNHLEQMRDYVLWSSCKEAIKLAKEAMEEESIISKNIALAGLIGYVSEGLRQAREYKTANLPDCNHEWQTTCGVTGWVQCVKCEAEQECDGCPECPLEWRSGG